jgi:hypothetical protein
LFFAPVLGVRTTDLAATAVSKLKIIHCGHLVGIDEATIASGYVDSYDSSLGEYGSQPVGENGHVCSNGDIFVKSGEIHGDATPGEGHDVILSGNALVTGSTDSHSDVEYSRAELGDADTANDNDSVDPNVWDNQGNLKIPTSRVLEFSGGTIYIEGDLHINGEFRITAPTTVYVMGDAYIAGQGFVNTTKIPANLKVFVLAESRSAVGKADFAGSSNFYGVVYAPTVDVKVSGNSDFFGAVVGRTLQFNNDGGVHYDEALTPFSRSLISIKLVE